MIRVIWYLCWLEVAGIPLNQLVQTPRLCINLVVQENEHRGSTCLILNSNPKVLDWHVLKCATTVLKCFNHKKRKKKKRQLSFKTITHGFCIFRSLYKKLEWLYGVWPPTLYFSFTRRGLCYRSSLLVEISDSRISLCVLELFFLAIE